MISFTCVNGNLLKKVDDEANVDDNGGGKLVYVIPIEKEVERGLESYLNRSTQEAIDAGANHIIFEINTPGGRVDWAKNIGNLLYDLDVPSTSFILSDALSARFYIALLTDNIYMKPNTTITSRRGIN